jgi:polyisoprenyl-phosphate glycosyltransferase
VAVDDGSTEPIPDDLAASLELQEIRSVTLVKLKCNLGHQRAIAVGLARAAKTKADAVVIMDAMARIAHKTYGSSLNGILPSRDIS